MALVVTRHHLWCRILRTVTHTADGNCLIPALTKVFRVTRLADPRNILITAFSVLKRKVLKSS